MSFLRARQRAMTALFPHQGNPTHLIPNRATQGIKSVSATTTDTDMTVKFTGKVSTSGFSVVGYSVTVNAIAGIVSGVTQPGPTDELDIKFSPAALSTQAVVVTYDGSGILVELLSRVKVAAWNETAVFP